MLDQSWVGQALDPIVVDVEAGQLRLFAKVTGMDLQTDPDTSALIAPPTFLFSLGMAQGDIFDLDRLGIEMGKVLHGSQSFEYTRPIRAGDRITLQRRITDRFDKKGGALEFIVVQTQASNQRGEAVGSMSSTLVVRHA